MNSPGASARLRWRGKPIKRTAFAVGELFAAEVLSFHSQSALGPTRMATRKVGTALQAINARIAALQAQAEVLRQKEISGVVAKIKDAIAHYGLTAADLGLAGSPGKPGKGAKGTRKVRAAVSTRKSVGAGKSSRPAKYRDDQGRVWSGIGKRPDWFKAALAAGKTPEDLLVKP